MASDVTYKGKHVRPASYGGSTPRGPERWARAFHNALRKPNSQAAELLFDRIALARDWTARWETSKKEVFAHRRLERDWRVQPATLTLGRPLYHTCSLFCATMTAQLDGAHRLKLLADAFIGEHATVTKERPARAKRCYFCGSKIKPVRGVQA